VFAEDNVCLDVVRDADVAARLVPLWIRVTTAAADVAARWAAASRVPAGVVEGPTGGTTASTTAIDGSTVAVAVAGAGDGDGDDFGVRAGALDGAGLRASTCWDEDGISPRVSAIGRSRLKAATPATITTHPHTGVTSTFGGRRGMAASYARVAIAVSTVRAGTRAMTLGSHWHTSLRRLFRWG
jgi:hypothetical protein